VTGAVTKTKRTVTKETENKIYLTHLYRTICLFCVSLVTVQVGVGLAGRCPARNGFWADLRGFAAQIGPKAECAGAAGPRAPADAGASERLLLEHQIYWSGLK
jgi:hypothetical protein